MISKAFTLEIEKIHTLLKAYKTIISHRRQFTKFRKDFFIMNKSTLTYKNTYSYIFFLIIVISFIPNHLRSQFLIQRSDATAAGEITVYGMPETPGSIKNNIHFDLTVLSFPFNITFNDTTIALCSNTEIFGLCYYFNMPIQLGDMDLIVLYADQTEKTELIYEADSIGTLITLAGSAQALRVDYSIVFTDLQTGTTIITNTGYLFFTKSGLYAEVHDLEGEYVALVYSWTDYTTGLDKNDDLTFDSYKLFQNYPNPFNPSTTIEYALPVAETVRLTVFNMLGQQVATLMNGEQLPAGIHTATLEAVDLPSGVYYYRITSASFSETKKMLLLK